MPNMQFHVVQQIKKGYINKYYVETMNPKSGELSNTDWNGDRLFSLPLFPEMTEHDVDYVVETIKQILK